jgi:hypothetical protein
MWFKLTMQKSQKPIVRQTMNRLCHFAAVHSTPSCGVYRLPFGIRKTFAASLLRSKVQPKKRQICSLHGERLSGYISEATPTRRLVLAVHIRARVTFRDVGR